MITRTNDHESLAFTLDGEVELYEGVERVYHCSAPEGAQGFDFLYALCPRTGEPRWYQITGHWDDHVTLEPIKRSDVEGEVRWADNGATVTRGLY